jgi:5'-3' exonuclease
MKNETEYVFVNNTNNLAVWKGTGVNAWNWFYPTHFRTEVTESSMKSMAEAMNCKVYKSF